MKNNYPQEYRRSSNKNFKEIAGPMIASQKKKEGELFLPITGAGGSLAKPTQSEAESRAEETDP